MQEFDSFIDAITESVLSSAVSAGYDAIFEAKHGMIGNILDRLAHKVAEIYDLDMPVAKKRVVELQRITMDKFAPLVGKGPDGKNYKPETQPEFKEKMTKYFATVLTMLCTDMGYILQNNAHDRSNLSKFYVAFNYMVRHYDQEFDGTLKRITTGEQYTPEKIVEEFYLPAKEESLSKAGLTALPGNDTKHSGMYTIQHIKDGDEASEYEGHVQWCICYDPVQYWDTYSEGGENKCYFLLQDGFERLSEGEDDDYLRSADAELLPFTGEDSDDVYGRSMIGLFVNREGKIAYLFNRNNRKNHIYSEDDLERMLGGSFSDLCPGYGPDESGCTDGKSVDWFNASVIALYDAHPDKYNNIGDAARHIIGSQEEGDWRHEVSGRFLFRFGPASETEWEEEYDEETGEYCASENDHWGDSFVDDYGDRARFNIYDCNARRCVLNAWATSVREISATRVEVDMDAVENTYDLVNGRWQYREWVTYHSSIGNEHDNEAEKYSIGTYDKKNRLYRNDTGEPVSNWTRELIRNANRHNPRYVEIGGRNLYDINEEKYVFGNGMLHIGQCGLPCRDDNSIAMYAINDRMSPMELYRIPTAGHGDIEKMDIPDMDADSDALDEDRGILGWLSYNRHGPVSCLSVPLRAYRTVERLYAIVEPRVPYKPILPWCEEISIFDDKQVVIIEKPSSVAGMYRMDGSTVMPGTFTTIVRDCKYVVEPASGTLLTINDGGRVLGRLPEYATGNTVVSVYNMPNSLSGKMGLPAGCEDHILVIERKRTDTDDKHYYSVIDAESLKSALYDGWAQYVLKRDPVTNVDGCYLVDMNGTYRYPDGSEVPPDRIPIGK